MILPPNYLGCCSEIHHIDNYDFYRVCIIVRLKTLEGATTLDVVFNMARLEWETTRYALDEGGDEDSIKSLRAYKAQHVRKLRAKGIRRWEKKKK